MMPLPSLSSVGSIMQKVNDSVVVIAAVVALMNQVEGVPGQDKKKMAMDALNKLEGDFKIDIPDQITSVVIEVLLIVGKQLGWIKPLPDTSKK